MNIFRLIAHAGLLIHMGQDVQSIADNLIKHVEKFPSKAEFIKLLEDAIEFLASGVLTLPDDVSKQIGDSLASVKDELSKVNLA